VTGSNDSDSERQSQLPIWAQIGNEEILCLSVDDVLRKFRSSPSGLASDIARENLEIYGPNEVAQTKKRAAIVKFALQFKNPLVLILLIAGTISGILGDIPSAVIISSIVLLSIVLTFFQESRAERAALGLKERVAVTATVLRDGNKKEVKLADLVPGDIILLSAGDIMPADARAITAKDFFIDQSALTGESFPAEKTVLPVKPECVPTVTEWDNYLFMGTSVVSGSASAVVVKTGGSTEYGKIVEKIVARRPETEFERGLRRFGYLIMQVTFLLVTFVFLILSIREGSNGVLPSFLFAVALAVGLTPELLPMILSINLSKGAISMSKKGVIIKRLASIQNFGNMDVLCTDKTGTLTENKVILELHVDMEGKENEKVLLQSYLNSHYQTGLKSPLDEAILAHKEVVIKNYEKVDEVPFDFNRRRVSVVVQYEGQRFFITKGAPEEIIRICSYYEADELISDITNEVQRKIEQKYYDLSSEGFRVLGIAYKKLKQEKTIYSVNDESDMVFLGFVAFLDPPKKTSKESLQMLKKSGIELKILTGDNELVTRKVCEQLGFEIKGIVIGNELAKMNDDAISRVVEEANIFARVTPAQKDRIMSSLRSNGHVVGFLGDGINDAPSMKVADVSISVDNAVDVAKDSADIILLDKDLTVLEEGVLEGRRTFGNTMKYVMMGVSSNFGNMFSAAGAALFLKFLPMLPTQILLNNLLYDISELAIPTDNVDVEYVEKPKRLDITYVRNFMLWFGPISSIFDFLTFYVMLTVFNAWNNPDLFRTAWFVESLCTQTLIIFVIRTRRSPFLRSKPSKLLFISSVSVVGFALILPLSFIGKWFKFVDLSASFYLILAVFIVVYLTLVETVKRPFYARYAGRLEQALVPQKALLHGPKYLSPAARLVQNAIAVVCLRPEDEISVDSLLNDLGASLNYPIDSEQYVHALHYLKRAGLVDIDWRKGIVKRKNTLKAFVTDLSKGEVWPTVKSDWRKMGQIIEAKYGKVNPDCTVYSTLQNPGLGSYC
jgi:Mg2+-importing ATPase